MINPKDLMQGNILRRRFWNPHPETPSYMFTNVRVNAIAENHCNVSDIGDKGKNKHLFINLYPIPLTEKILLDSGFELYHENDFGRQFELKTGSSRFYVVINDEKNTFAIQLEFAPINNIRCHETSYVHNLQNAYRLATGNDLEIVINA